MCLPAVPLLIASTVVSAIGAGYSAYSQAQQSKYSAKVSEQNARLEAQAADMANQATREEALAHYRKVGQLKGQQQAAQAASGVDTNFGTSAAIADDTEMMSREDVSRIYSQGEQRTRGFDISSANYKAQASASRQAATSAMIGGALKVGETILGGASQYSKLKAGMKKPPKLKYDFGGL